MDPEKTKNFIDDLQRIVNSFLTIEGFSVGIGDMIADDETVIKSMKLFKKINKTLKRLCRNSFKYI